MTMATPSVHRHPGRKLKARSPSAGSKGRTFRAVAGDGRGEGSIGVLSVLRLFFLVVAVVAGIAGLVMLFAPGDTDDYFSWPIGPEPLAALVGGFYVASAVVFGLAARRTDWPAVRGLCLGVLALTIPTLVATARHHDVFDFGRGQALLWVVLFIASPCAYGTVLYLQRGKAGQAAGAQMPGWARVVAAVLGLGYVAFAIWCWVDPASLAEHMPFLLPALSGAFLGCWALFLGTLALFVARRPVWREARLPLLAVTLWPLAGIVAALLTFDDLESGRRAGYLIALVVLTLIGGGLLLVTREQAPAPSGASGSPGAAS
jgi:hypothetical protein